MKPYYKDDQITLYHGDSLSVLKEIPDESVNCVMTSPPYWGLRAYGTNPQIWDGDENCEHKWGDKIPPRGHKSGKPGPNASVGSVEAQDEVRRGKGTNFCIKCGAWRGELGLEPDFNLYIKHLCDIFSEVKRVLKKDGTCWVNLGDTYMNNSSYSEKGRQGYGKDKIGMIYKDSDKVKQKSLIGIPDRFKIEMIDRGWICRNEIIWYKPNCMPSSASDRFTVDFEKVFFFTKNKKYWFEQQFEEHSRDWTGCGGNIAGKGIHKKNDGYKEVNGEGVIPNPKGRNMRTVWEITTKGFSEAHFAVFPEELVETPIKAGCPKGGVVMDIFHGSGTTGKVALKFGSKYTGIELNEEYLKMSLDTRLKQKYLEI